MTDTKQKSQTSAHSSSSGNDEDVIEFDLSSNLTAEEKSPELHIQLEDEESPETVLPVQEFSLKSPEPSESSPQSTGNFSLAGDDVMDIFETLLGKIEKLKSDHEKSIRDHNETIAREKALIKEEESDYEKKLQKMLSMLDTLKSKLAGTSFTSTKQQRNK